MTATSLLLRIYRITILRGGGLVLTLVLTALQAAAFGTGPAGDAFHLVRQSLASLTSGAEVGIQKLLVPYFVHKGGGAAARRRLLIWLGGGGLIFALVLALLAPVLLRWIAPGFDAARQDIAVVIFRVLVFGLPAYALTAVMASQAFAERRFSLATFAGLLPRVFGVLAFAVFGFSLTAYGLAGWLLAGMMAMLVLVWGSRIWHRDAATALDTSQSPLQTLTKGRVAAIVIIILTQVLLTWSNGFLASLGPAGSAAILFLSLRLISAVPALANSAVSTVYYTEFAHAAAQDTSADTDARATQVGASLATSAFFILPFCGLLFVAADPIIGLLLERGNFTAQDRVHMATLVPVIAPMLIFNALFGALQNSVLADTSAPAFRIVSVTAAVALALRIGFGLALVPTLGLVGLAIALLSSAAGQALMILWMTFNDHRGAFSGILARRLRTITLCALAASLVGYGSVAVALPLAVTIGAFGLGYLGLAVVLRVPEAYQILPARLRG